MAVDHLLISVFFTIVSMLFVFWAADLIVQGISSYARRLGMSDYIAGLVVVAMAASMPEILASLTGLLSGQSDILFGTILGTNMVHVALVGGLLAVLGKKVNVESTILSKVLLPLYLALLVPFVLILIDGELGRIDGVVLVTLFVIYLVWLWHQEEKTGHMRSVLARKLYRDVFIFLGSLIVLLIASQTLVLSSVVFAAIIGIPSYFIALTVIAVGGALPDLALGIKSIRQGHQDIGMGDVLGSVILELLLFFGLVGLLHPVRVATGEVINAMIFLAIGLAILLYIIKKKYMTWKHGILLLSLYAVFLTIEIYKVVTA